jgi:hypothetical protein
MALPILGLRVRLRGQAAETHEVSYSATFIDGTSVGPVAAGEACEAESLSPVEAFQVVLRRKGEAVEPAAPAVAAEAEEQGPEAEPPEVAAEAVPLPGPAAAAKSVARKPAKGESKGKAKTKLPPPGRGR